MESLVTSLETSKKLKAAGFPQETEFYFGWSAKAQEYVLNQSPSQEDHRFIAAVSAQEIADQLPNDVVLSQNPKWFARSATTTAASADTMAEALAGLWLKLKEKVMAEQSFEDKLKDRLVELVDEYFPKNDTAAVGGAPTPGRGEAAAMGALLIKEAQTACMADKQAYALEVLEGLKEQTVIGWEPGMEHPTGVEFRLIDQAIQKIKEAK
jgi:hypothetical protein